MGCDGVAYKESAGERDFELKGSASLARLWLEIDEQWPGFKFLGLGFYQAWIWLLYSSDALIAGADAQRMVLGTNAIFSLYLLSTAALSLSLIAASLFPRAIERVLERRVLAVLAAACATFATMGVGAALSLDAEYARLLFDLCGILSGFGTASVVLRLGGIYAQLDTRRGTTYTALAFVFACLMYFVALGLPSAVSLAITALLPLAAMLCTMMGGESAQMIDASLAKPRAARRFSRGMFVRLVFAVGVFSVVVGVVRGFTTLDQTIDVFSDQGAIVVFCSALAALLLFSVVGLLSRDFDISKLHYPIIILAAAGILLSPLLEDSVFNGYFVGVAYNCFSMMVWCLLSHTAYVSDMSWVRVFGLGRGASAFGTTVGWMLGSQLLSEHQGDATTVHAAVLVMAFALIVVALLVMGSNASDDSALRARGGSGDDGGDGASVAESAVPLDYSPASSSARSASAADSAWDSASVSVGSPGASGSSDASGGMGSDRLASATSSKEREETSWRDACAQVADLYGLSAREQEVLQLLARGRTIDYIATDLVISFNTAKSHVRHVYVKMGVHTRQELIDLIESKHVG